MTVPRATQPKSIRCLGVTARTILIVATSLSLAACSAGSGGVVSGTDYAPNYDFSEFYAATNHRTFLAVVAGNPFPNLPREEMQQRLLPEMQANRPPSDLTFTYAALAEPPHPWYRVVLVFDPAKDLMASSVCAGQIRLLPEPSGLFNLFAVYCRNAEALAQTTTRTPAADPEDPRVANAFKQVFLELFNPFRRPEYRPLAPFFRR
jgi:hypothetical protein